MSLTVTTSIRTNWKLNNAVLRMNMLNMLETKSTVPNDERIPPKKSIVRLSAEVTRENLGKQ